jgi:hypothetical protein
MNCAPTEDENETDRDPESSCVLRGLLLAAPKLGDFTT